MADKKTPSKKTAPANRAAARATAPPFPTTLKCPNYSYIISLGTAREVSDLARKDDVYGCTDHPTLQIMIQQDLAYAVKRITLLHEILHVAFSLGVPSHGWDVRAFANEGSDIEEFLVCGLETPILFLLRNNPVVVNYLLWKGDE